MTDSRIPLMGQMPNIMMPSEAMANAARAKAAMNQNAMFDREMQDRDDVEAAYRDSGGDINAMMQDPRIGFETRMKVGDLQASQAKAARADKTADLDFMLKGAEYTAQLASAAQNQQEWDAVRDQMVEVLGEDAAQRFPAQFSPEAQAQVVNGAMSFKDKMAQQAEARKQQAEDRRYEQNERRIDQGERRIEAALSRGDGGDKAPAHYRFKPDGTLEPIPGGAADSKMQLQNTKLQAQLGKDVAKLENADASANATLALLQKIKNHPGKTDAVGGSSVFNLAAIPGGPRKDFLVQLDQLKGQQFLQAFESLKGGGAITNVEGQKAEQAIANMNTAQSEEQFDAAVADFESVVRELQKRTQGRLIKYEMDDQSLGLSPNASSAAERSVVRTGTVNGRKVIQYSDGTTEYAQ